MPKAGSRRVIGIDMSVQIPARKNRAILPAWSGEPRLDLQAPTVALATEGDMRCEIFDCAYGALFVVHIFSIRIRRRPQGALIRGTDQL